MNQDDLNKIAKVFSDDYYVVLTDNILRVNKKYSRDNIVFNLTRKIYLVNLTRTDSLVKKINETLKILGWQ